MTTTKAEKEKMISQYKMNENDTGSAQLQIARLTGHIVDLTKHLQENPKDFSSKRGLFKSISCRRKLLKYLERKDEKQYKELIKSLSLKR